MFDSLSPLLQFVTILAIFTCVSIVGFELGRYLKKRRFRVSVKLWTPY